MATPLDSAQPTIGGLMALLASLRAGRMGSTLAPLKRLSAFARPYRRRILLALVGVLVGGVLSLAGPLAWSFLVDSIVPGGDPSLLTRVTLALIAIYLLQTLSLSFFNLRRTGERKQADTCNDPSGVCHWRANRCSTKRRRQ